jgi:hypothetical protein
MIPLDKLCITVSGTTSEEIWRELRSSVGGTMVDTPDGVDLMNQEIADYNTWVAENGVVPFDKWLKWLFRVGTVRYGNLPANKTHEGKVGHSYAPCPYSTQSDDGRTRLMLKLAPTDPLPAKADHTDSGVIYYLSTTSRGTKWGHGCTFIGCPYSILNDGQRYIHI